MQFYLNSAVMCAVSRASSVTDFQLNFRTIKFKKNSV